MIDNEECNLMFSVVMLSYNFKNYISEALNSIINQKHIFNYDIVIGDDCSTDNTQSIIENFRKQYPNIIKPVYNNINIGAMQNFYSTILRAKGKYIMLCSGDDYWLPGKVEKQINFMERNLDFDVCYGKADLLIQKENTIKSTIGDNYINFKDIISKGNLIPSLTLCIRNTFFNQYINQVNPQNKNWLMEDYPFLIYSAFESSIYFFNQKFAVYRVIDNSISHQLDVQKQLKYNKSIYECKKYFADLYGIVINSWNDKEELKKLHYNRKQNTFMIFVKKLIKLFMPYGIIILIRNNKKNRNIK